jgi:enoyl-CoA hydratase
MTKKVFPEYETILFDVADGIGTITINRPDKLNALSETVIDELDDCINRASAENEVKGVIITGAGSKSFVAGADIARFTSLDPTSGYEFALRGQTVFGAIESLRKPVLAAVNGYALGGGCELALACHLRIASENAVFGQPEVNLGIIPGYGGTQRLPRVVGRGIALEMILTGNPIKAQRAHEVGLVSAVVPPEDLPARARKLIGAVLSGSSVAVSMALSAVYAEGTAKQGMELEALLFGQACGTNDFREGVSAFLEKRKPEFPGN